MKSLATQCTITETKLRFPQWENLYPLGRETSNGARLEFLKGTTVIGSGSSQSQPNTRGKTTSSAGRATRLILASVST